MVAEGSFSCSSVGFALEIAGVRRLTWGTTQQHPLQNSLEGQTYGTSGILGATQRRQQLVVNLRRVPPPPTLPPSGPRGSSQWTTPRNRSTL